MKRRSSNSDLVADGSGSSLVVCRLGKTVAVKDIESFLEQAYEVLNLFKAKAENHS